MTRVRVAVTDEYLSRLVRNPARGLLEMLDNALDADSHEITVTYERSALGAITSVTVSDDGAGMSAAVALSAFQDLGNSWKLTSRISAGGRRHRGRRGHGRWAAFAMGEDVTWTSLASSGSGDAAALASVRVSGSSATPGEFEIDGPTEASGRTGTVVVVTNITERAQALDRPDLRRRLLERYAPALRRQRSLSMTIDGTTLDPDEVTKSEQQLPLDLSNIEGYSTGDADPAPVLTVVDWAPGVRSGQPTLVLAAGDGEGLYDLIDAVPYAVWPYTAYLAWDGFTAHRDVLPLAGMAPVPVPELIEAARVALREHIAERRASAGSALLESWKAEDTYPYRGVPAGPLEEAERDLFDLVAVTAATGIAGGTTSSRRLALRLIQEALQNDPTQLTGILTKVLELAPTELDDLSEILTRTGLPRLIAAGKLITHRVDVLDGLTALLADPAEAARVLERRHLHEIVAAEPWLFGEQYALAVSDRTLTSALEAHRRLIGDRVLLDPAAATERDGVARVGAAGSGQPDVPVLLGDGRAGRIDLMLSRVAEFSPSVRQHLVVELKRPAVRIGADACSQTEQYAIAIAGDRRFHQADVRWEFLLIGTTLDDFTAERVGDDGVLFARNNLTVRVMTWDTLLHARRHHIEFVQQALQVRTTQTGGLAELRKLHGEYLPPAESPELRET